MKHPKIARLLLTLRRPAQKRAVVTTGALLVFRLARAGQLGARLISGRDSPDKRHCRPWPPIWFTVRLCDAANRRVVPYGDRHCTRRRDVRSESAFGGTAEVGSRSREDRF
jgi:hypothetical protein